MKRLILCFTFWRLFLFLVAAIAPSIIPQFGARFPYYQELMSSGLPQFIWSFANFDGVHYLAVAKEGYRFQFTQAFFPLYPLVVRFFSFFTLGNYILAGLIVSNLAFLGAILLFFRLVKKSFGEKTAFWSILFLLAFPTSFYFGSLYTESLFFLFIVSFFYLLELGKVWQAAIIGIFASATRLIGAFLTLSVMNQKKVWQKLTLLAVPLGLVAYMIYLKIKFNDPLYFLNSQTIFGQERSTTEIILLPQVFYRYLKILFTTGGLMFVNALFELVSTVFALAILLFALKKIKMEWVVFSLLAVLTPTLTGTFASMPRYVLVAFPMYIFLGSIKNTQIKILILAIFVIMLCAATTLFTRGYWVA